MLSDLEISQSVKLKPISEVAGGLGILPGELEHYGPYKAKLGYSLSRRVENNPDGRLILVTAVNPTPAGEGKTTTSIGLGQAMARLGKKTMLALREPSLGPVFGMKGGAAGGGYSQVLPMEDINLHFTGDLHAITAADNLLCSMLDNHMQQGNRLNIDPRRVLIKRALDINDRALRQINIGLGGTANGVPREDSFQITAASEVMAILCLSSGLIDMKERLGEILVAYDRTGEPIFARDLKAEGAMAVVLKDAVKPNLVQSVEGVPCLIHGGPFANIAHGCNSLIATRLALKLADYVVTEAGFGADLGAEKFFDIKCRKGGLKPSAAVLVATVRALKYNGGIKRTELGTENVEALIKGAENLRVHVENLKGFGLPVVVAVNAFPTDTAAEHEALVAFCRDLGVPCAISRVFSDGGAGGEQLAEMVVAACEQPNGFTHLYDESLPVLEKIETIVKKIYRGSGVSVSPKAGKAIEKIERMGYGTLPVCIAKTQYSLSDDPALLGAPEGFEIGLRDVTLSAGAGFIVAITGDIMTMPGLPRVPSAEALDIDQDGVVTGLF